MKKFLFLLLLLIPVNVLAQPSLPCSANSGRWIVTVDSAVLWVCNSNSTAWINATAGSGGSIPTGLITLVFSGTCPAGFDEVVELNGKTLIGTLAANSNVGTTGGADNITPGGTNSAPVFTGTAFTDIINHVHTIATGTGATGNFSQVIGTVDTSSGGTGATPTQTTLGTRTVATINGVASITPAGTINTPSFTGNSFDNRSAFIRVIFCRKS